LALAGLVGAVLLGWRKHLIDILAKSSNNQLKGPQ